MLHCSTKSSRRSLATRSSLVASSAIAPSPCFATSPRLDSLNYRHSHPIDGRMAHANTIPFSHFADLIETLAALAPRRVGTKRKSPGDGPVVSNQLQVVQNWIRSVNRAYPPREEGKDGLLPEGTVRIFLRLFFPEEGPRRRCVQVAALLWSRRPRPPRWKLTRPAHRYGMQETILANHLCRFFQIKEGRFDDWNAPSLGERSVNSGCLGTEVQKWMELRGRGRKDSQAGLTLGR